MPHELVLPAYILAVSLIAFAIMLCDLGRDRRGKDPLPWPLWAVASAAGGAFGTLAAFLVTRTHIAKATVARFFCGLAFSILWILILILASGAISVTANAFFASLARDHTPLAIYLAIANLADFALFGIDKRQAVHAGSRIPEAVLLGVGLAGGAPGALLSMHLFHHKTRRAYFRWGLWLFLAIDALLIVFLMAEGIL